MKKMTRFLSFALCILLFSQTLLAQEDESPLSISTDIYSRYVWRGLDFGSSPSIQPGIEYNKKGFTFGVWGAYTTNLNAPAQEADIYIGYTFLDEMLSFTLTDYFFPTDGINNNYFDYKKASTGHVFEASLTFNGTADFPLTLLIGTNFYGADATHINGNIMYSTYAEVGYSFDVKGTGLDVFCGANLLGANQDDINAGLGGFYNDDPGIINLGLTASKELQINDKFTIPFEVSLITNPCNKNIFLVAGISF